MSETNLYGRIITRRQIGEALRDHILAGFEHYLRDVQRDTGWEDVDPDPANWPVPYIHTRFTWSETEVVNLVENDLPALILGSPGLLEAPMQEGDGEQSGTFVFGLHSLVSGLDENWTDRLMGEYVAALWALVTQRPDVGGGIMIGKVADVGYDALGQVASRTLAAGTVTVPVVVEEVVNARMGPGGDLPDDPDLDPGPFAEMLTGDLTVDRIGD